MAWGIYDASARVMQRESASSPIWIHVQKTKRQRGDVHCLSLELAIKLRDCLDKAITDVENRRAGEE